MEIRGWASSTSAGCTGRGWCGSQAVGHGAPEEWDALKEYERLGFRKNHRSGDRLPCYDSGETGATSHDRGIAAPDQKLKVAGIQMAREFMKLIEAMRYEGVRRYEPIQPTSCHVHHSKQLGLHAQAMLLVNRFPSHLGSVHRKEVPKRTPKSIMGALTWRRSRQPDHGAGRGPDVRRPFMPSENLWKKFGED